MRAQLPQSMPKQTPSGGSTSGNPDDDDDSTEGRGTNTNARKAGNGGGSEGSHDGGSDSIRAEFRELLGTVASLKPADREERLLRENFTVRDRLRTAKRQLEEAKKGGVPQGAVVLTGDDATAFAAVQKIGVPLKDLPARLAERDTLHAEKTERDARALNERVASDLGLNPRAFAMFAKANDLVISFKEVKVKDEETGKYIAEEIPMVRKKGEADDKAKPLAEALEADFTDDDIALLTTEAAASRDEFGADDRTTSTRSGASSSSATDDGPTRGVRFPSQRANAPTGASAQRKNDEKARESKANSGRYSM